MATIAMPIRIFPLNPTSFFLSNKKEGMPVMARSSNENPKASIPDLSICSAVE